MLQEILIILQTHSKGNPPDIGDLQRYCSDTKSEVSRRCISSLFHTIEFAKQQLPTFKFKLIILDDDSENSFIDFLKKKVESASFECKLEHTTVRGLHPSIMKCYELGKELGKDIVYFAQDDYLYYETAMYEMLEAYYRFKEISGLNVCIFPYDDPFRYTLMQYNYKVLLGEKRHWRNAYHTASCFMMHHDTIVNNWDLFVAMGTGERGSEVEDRSINRLFLDYKEFPKRNLDHLLFTPIPSLALHMGYESQKDPYLNWKELWEKFANG